MSVYVDELRNVPSAVGRHGNLHFHRSCHLLADTDDELHEFASRIGCRVPEWAHDGTILHYDLTPWMRGRALAAGARPIGRREVVELILRRRAAPVCALTT